jgi:hypothetical protein
MYIRRIPAIQTPIIYRISKKYHFYPLFHHSNHTKTGNFVQTITNKHNGSRYNTGL